MKLIVGLGNPGQQYKYTRHNAGFLAMDFILNDGDGLMLAKPSHEFKSEVHTLNIGDQKVMFVKPLTYMNDSGQALKVICNFYKMDISNDLLVLHDDADLPLGTIRTTASSSSAGQNGVQSIINELGTQNFHRVRIGVESRADRSEKNTADFVLEDFTKDELLVLNNEVFGKVKEEVEKFIK